MKCFCMLLVFFSTFHFFYLAYYLIIWFLLVFKTLFIKSSCTLLIYTNIRRQKKRNILVFGHTSIRLSAVTLIIFLPCKHDKERIIE